MHQLISLKRYSYNKGCLQMVEGCSYLRTGGGEAGFIHGEGRGILSVILLKDVSFICSTLTVATKL